MGKNTPSKTLCENWSGLEHTLGAKNGVLLPLHFVGQLAK